jgi:hypothetical protein
MIIYALLGLVLVSLIYIYIEKKEKKKLISDAKTFISKHHDDLMTLPNKREYKITPTLDNINVYLYKHGDLYLRSILKDIGDLSIKELKYFSLERFKNYLQDYLINSANKIEFFRYKGNYHLYFPFKVSDSEMIILVFEKQVTLIDDLIKR